MHQLDPALALATHPLLVAAPLAVAAALGIAFAGWTRQRARPARGRDAAAAELRRTQAALLEAREELARRAAELDRAHAELAAAEREIVRLRRNDPATALATRRVLDEGLAAEWQRCARRGEAVSLLVVALDDFAPRVLEQGPVATEALFARVAAVVREEGRRSSDLAARLREDAVALLLPETDADGATVVADRVAARLAALTDDAGSRPEIRLATASARPASVSGPGANGHRLVIAAETELANHGPLPAPRPIFVPHAASAVA